MSGITFWEWFTAHRSSVADGRTPAAAVRQHFHQDYANLVCDVRLDLTPATLIVSADGRREFFPEVIAAVRQAPPVPGWRVRAFRPRGSIDVRVMVNNTTLGPDDIWCSTEPGPHGLHLRLFIRGLSTATDRTLATAAVVLLDNALGECEAGTLIRHLSRFPLPADVNAEGRFPFRELPTRIV